MLNLLKILLINNNLVFSETLKKQLENTGEFEIEITSIEKSINKLKEQYFNLIILEVIPEKNGFELLKFVQENKDILKNPQIQTIILTEHACLKNAVQSIKLGAADFVSQPYDIVDLQTTIQKVLETEIAY